MYTYVTVYNYNNFLFQILINALMEYLDVIRPALTQLEVTLAHVSQDFTLLMQMAIHVIVLCT